MAMMPFNLSVFFHSRVLAISSPPDCKPGKVIGDEPEGAGEKKLR